MSSQLSFANAHFGALNSRRLLIETLYAVKPFHEALTVIGAHAVHVWVQDAWGPVDMEATRDADLVLNPVFVAEDPKLIDLLNTIDIVPALKDRPGIYGLREETDLSFGERTTIDFIVPEAYAGKGSRSAQMQGQPKAAGRAAGLELALWDRHEVEIATIDEPILTISTHVAGPAALLVSKAHKVSERLLEYQSRPDRLRPKDLGDIALLMMVSDPVECSEVINENVKLHPEIEEAVVSGARYLMELFSSSSKDLMYNYASASLSARFEEEEVVGSINVWLDKFSASRLA